MTAFLRMPWKTSRFSRNGLNGSVFISRCQSGPEAVSRLVGYVLDAKVHLQGVALRCLVDPWPIGAVDWVEAPATAAVAPQRVASTTPANGAAAADGGKAQGAKVEQMRERLRRDGFANPYRLRKQTVEPVFGQIKQACGFRQFLMRGLNKVAAEWAMLCTVHNINKLAGAQRSMKPA